MRSVEDESSGMAKAHRAAFFLCSYHIKATGATEGSAAQPGQSTSHNAKEERMGNIIRDLWFVLAGGHNRTGLKEIR